ncbi:ABC transporter ATP-binding protein [Blautia schinkii]|nr:ABC transporter ATP-binding protein [Blautia schinkii]
MHELRISGLGKGFKGKTAICEIDTVLRSGVYGLLGENGAGKTTLMRMLCGLLEPSRGQILCDGTEISRLGGQYRRLLGYLPQNFGYYPDYTARRFLRYMAALKALPMDYAERRITELLELVHLSEEENKKLKTFSGGMIKRIGIAQALLNDPEILILDEPTSGLDPNERVRFRNIISSLSKQKTIILSTHIVSDIEYIADEIMMMKQGHITAEGTVEEIVASVGKYVWQCLVTAGEAESMRGKYVIANLKNQQENVLLRVISTEKPCAQAVHPEASLEDAYLYYLNMCDE